MIWRSLQLNLRKSGKKRPLAMAARSKAQIGEIEQGLFANRKCGIRSLARPILSSCSATRPARGLDGRECRRFVCRFERSDLRLRHSGAADRIHRRLFLRHGRLRHGGEMPRFPWKNHRGINAPIRSPPGRTRSSRERRRAQRAIVSSACMAFRQTDGSFGAYFALGRNEMPCRSQTRFWA